MNTFQCPECRYSNPLGAASCASCLLIFEKHNKKTEGSTDSIRGTTQLNALWEKVMANYDSMEVHENFVKQSFALKGLPFASQQYRKMLEINPHEEMAVKMREKIINMATVTFAMPDRPAPPKSGFLKNILIFIVSMAIVMAFFIFLK